MDGTSMAAAHVTGTIALVLSSAANSGRPVPTSNQVVAALRQNTRNSSGRWDRGIGYGVVDVSKFLASKGF